MQSFRLFFKLIKNKSLPIVFITIAFSLYVFFFMNKGMYEQQESDLVKVAVTNYNKEDALWKQLSDLLSNYCALYDYREQKIEDNLTPLKIDATIVVPYDFTKELLEGHKVQLEYQNISNNSLNHNIEDLMNMYINAAHGYATQKDNIDITSMLEFLNKMFEPSVNYIMVGQRKTLINYGILEKYFRIGAFLVFTVCLLGTGRALHSIQNINIQRKNELSPFPESMRNMQIITGSFIFILLYDVFLIILSFAYDSPIFIDKYIVSFWINIIIFSICVLSISFFVPILVKQREINMLVAFILPIIFCYMSGIFTSQDEIGKALLNISYFTPTYWFAKGNTIIMNAGYGELNIIELIPTILIQGLFTVAIVCMTILLGKKNRSNN